MEPRISLITLTTLAFPMSEPRPADCPHER